jgi:hypothetical protein
MNRIRLAKYVRRLYVFFLCALLLTVITLTFGSAFAKMDWAKNKNDKAAAKVINHMEKMKEKCPWIDEKKKQVEKKLQDGTISWHKSCLHCHEEGQGAP